MMVKIVHDELVELMGGDKTDINIKINPSVISDCRSSGFRKNNIQRKTCKMGKDQKEEKSFACCL